jgi:hypothetical protein
VKTPRDEAGPCRPAGHDADSGGSRKARCSQVLHRETRRELSQILARPARPEDGNAQTMFSPVEPGTARPPVCSGKRWSRSSHFISLGI